MALFSTLNSYDPLILDTSYIEEASKYIPSNGQIDIHDAERLSIVFLEAADKITDEIARCSAYVGFCEAERRDAKAVAIDNRITGSTGTKVAGTIAVQMFGNDVSYKEAHKRQSVGDAFLDWLRTKYKNLMAAHILCKDILKIHYSGREQGNWQTAHSFDSDDELDYDNSSKIDKSDITSKDKSPGADEW